MSFAFADKTFLLFLQVRFPQYSRGCGYIFTFGGKIQTPVICVRTLLLNKFHRYSVG